MKKTLPCLVLVVLIACAGVSVWAQEKVDLEMVSRIRYEGFRNSKVMDLASSLMDGIGQRLTGSPNLKRANEWTRDQLTSFGLSNAHLESWGPFGRGWANQYVSVRMVSPDVAPLIAYAKAWTPGTNGAVKGKCIRVKIEDTKDFEKYRGKLAGLIVIFGPDPEVKTVSQALFERLSDKADTLELDQIVIRFEADIGEAHHRLSDMPEAIAHYTAFLKQLFPFPDVMRDFLEKLRLASRGEGLG